MIALGFRESDGSVLSLPLNTDIYELTARKLELEVGLDILRKRIAMDKTGDLKAQKLPIKAGKNAAVRVGEHKTEEEESPLETARYDFIITIYTLHTLHRSTDATPRPTAVNKKIVMDLKEEKMKRQKAETALHQQSALIRELQKVVTALETKENTQLTVRQGLTIARLDTDTKLDVKKTANALGKDSFGFDSSKSDAASSHRNISSTSHGKTKSRGIEAKGPQHSSDQASTIVHANTRVGDTKIEVANVHGFKRGMKVLVGSGATAEIKTIVGIGSLILDSPLAFPHTIGEKVYAVAPTRHNLHLLEKRMMQEFIVGIVMEEIIPTAVSAGETHRVQLLLNNDYSKRPVSTHNIVFEPTGIMQISSGGQATSMTASIAKCGTIMYAKKGAAYCLDSNLSAVNLVQVFMDLSNTDDVPVREQQITFDNFSMGIELESSLHGLFSRVASSLAIPNTTLLFERYAGADGAMGWTQYFKMIYADHLLCGTSKEVFKTPHVPETAVVNEDEVEFLFRIFCLNDHDSDEVLTYSEVMCAFGDMDGMSPSLVDLNTCFQYEIDCSSPIPAVDFGAFVATRIKYAALVRTLPAGIRLSGRKQIRAVIRAKLADQGNFISPKDLLTALPSEILRSVQLSSGRTVEDLLDSMTSSLSQTEMESKLCGSSLGANVSFMTPRERYVAGSAASLDVAQVCLDSSGNRAFVLCKSGVVHVFDVFSCRKILEQRVIWAEPVISRTVEGRDNFYKWQKDSSITFVRDTSGNEKAADVERLSSNLSKYVLSMPHLQNVMSVDGGGGLVAVNCSATTSSICFLDELSLRRIHRIKAPGKLTGTVENSVREILRDIGGHKPPVHRDCAGAICALSLCVPKGIVICMLYQSPALHCVSMMTGEPLSVLYGHHNSITTYSLHLEEAFLLTGSADCTTRVWLLDDIVPAGVAFHRQMNADEKTLVMGSTHASKAPLRMLASDLCAILQVKPVWRRAVVSGFSNGLSVSSDPFPSHHTFEVEVRFEDSTVKSFANRSLLRSPAEAMANPYSPPSWNQPEPALFVGQDVAVYEVDPEAAALCCGRHLGVQYLSVKSFAEWASDVQNFINISMASSDQSPTDIARSLQAGGVDLHNKGSLVSFFLLILNSSHLLHQDSKSEGVRRPSNRLLFGGHASAITATSFSPVSKVIVTVDKKGWCCLWDTVNTRVSLSLIAPYVSPAIVGHHPFSMVAKAMVVDGLQLDNAQFGISSMCRLSCPQELEAPYPLSASCLTDAYKLDCKYKSDEVRVRGFVYVLTDLSHVCVESSAFVPGMVTLDSPDLFMSNDTILANEYTRMKGLSKLQKLFRSRKRVIRIVYVVSCAHDRLDKLAEDLSSYGVLQRGYTKTPSDKVELVCFEKVGSHEIAVQKSKASYSSTFTSRHGSGIVTNILGRNQIAVAMDGSNDILIIKASDVTVIFDRPSAFNEFHSDGSDAAPSRISLGCKVKFLLPKSDESAHNSTITRSTADVFVIQVDVTSERGVVSSHALSWIVGRVTLPTPACQASQLTISDAISRQIRLSYLKHHDSLFSAMACYLSERNFRLGAWRAVHAQTGIRLLQSALFINKEAKILHGELSGEQALSVVGALSPPYHCLFTLALSSLIALGVVDLLNKTHPLIAHMLDILGSRRDVIIALLRHPEVTPSGPIVSIDKVSELWLCRQGIRIEELYASYCFSVPGRHRAIKTIDRLNAEFEHLTLSTSNSHTDMIDADSMGPILREDLALSSILAEQVAEDSSDRSDETSLVNSDYKMNMSVLRAGRGQMHFLLRDHHLTNHLSMLRDKLIKSSKNVKAAITQSFLSVYQPLFHLLRDEASRPQMLGENSRRPEYPVIDHPDHSGTYSVLSSSKSEYFFSSHLITAELDIDSNEASESYLFFVWDNDRGADVCDLGEQGMRSLFGNCKRRIERLQTSVVGGKPIVQCVSDVAFEPSVLEDADGELLVMKWNRSWITMDKFISNMGGLGLLQSGRTELLREVSRGLIDAVASVHDAGFALRCLNLCNIVVDANNGCHIRVLPTPLLIEVEGGLTSKVDEKVFTEYSKWRDNVESPLPSGFTKKGIGTGKPELGFINLDAYSVGACLFHVAFGHPLPDLVGLESGKDVDVAAELLTAIIFDEIRSVIRTAIAPIQSATGYANDTKADEICSAHDSPIKLVLAALRKYSSRDIVILKSLWEAFSDIAINGDISTVGAAFVESAVVALWEKMFHGFAKKLRRHGAIGTRKLTDKLASFVSTAGASRVSIDRLRTLISNEFDLSLTTVECEVFVKSLFRCSERAFVDGKYDPESARKPIQEKIVGGMRYFITLFDDILAYGTFQETFFIICQFLKAAGNQHGYTNSYSSLTSIRQLSFFDDIPDLEQAIAIRLTHSYLSGYSSTPEEFVKKTMFTPLLACIRELFAKDFDRSVSSGDAKNILEHQLVHTHIETVSKVLNCIEELLLIESSSVAGRTIDISKLTSLLSWGVDIQWITDVAVHDILKHIVSSKLLHLLVTFSIRFLASDSAHEPSEEAHPGAAKHAYEGLSMGSRMLIRISKFFEYFIACMHGISKKLSKLRKNMALNLTPNEQELKRNEVVMDKTELLDRCYFAIATAISMLCTGDEVCPPLFGSRSDSLLDAYGDVFSMHRGDQKDLGLSSSAFVARKQWSAHLAKLFEPLVLDLASEDGRGNTSKLLCSAQEIEYADKTTTAISMHLLPIR